MYTIFYGIKQQKLLWFCHHSMKPLFLICVLLLSNICVSQNNSTPSRWSGGITTNLAIPGSSIIALQPCAEYKINNRFSAVAGYSFKFIDIDESEDAISNQKYGRLLLEGRFRFTKHEYKPAIYIGLQTSLSKRKFTEENSYFLYEHDDDSTTYYTKANVSSPVKTLSLQLGFTTAGRKRFYADIFAGMGVRFTHSKFSDIEGKRREFVLFEPRPFTYESGLEMARPYSFVHFNGGVRFFYHFRSK
jgi:hypothetical protein